MAANRKMPLVEDVAIPIIRSTLDNVPGLKVGSWVEDVLRREYPLINVRRLSGLSDPRRPDSLDKPVVELTIYAEQRFGLPAAMDLFMDARWALWNAVDKQTIVPGVGYIHSYFEVMGPTPFDAPFEDVFRIQGLYQLGLRPHTQ